MDQTIATSTLSHHSYPETPSQSHHYLNTQPSIQHLKTELVLLLLFVETPFGQVDPFDHFQVGTVVGLNY